MRRFTSSSSLFVPSSTTTTGGTIRTIVVYTNQIKRLLTRQPTTSINNNDHESTITSPRSSSSTYSSNMWLEEEDFTNKYRRRGWAIPLTKLKPGEERNSTSALFDKVFEYYNADCIIDEAFTKEVEEAKKILAEAPSSAHKSKTDVHYNIKNIKPNGTAYPLKQQEQFDTVSMMHGYQSKIWILASEVQRRRLRLMKGAKVSTIVQQVKSDLWNIDQFEEPEKLAKFPIFGYRKRAFASHISKELAKHVGEKNFSSGLFFSSNNLELYNMMSELKEDAEPILVKHTQLKEKELEQSTSSMKKRKLVSVYDLENPTDVIAKRYPDNNSMPASIATRPHFFVSGQPIDSPKSAHLLADTDENKNHERPMKFWISLDEIEKEGFRVDALRVDSIVVIDFITGAIEKGLLSGNSSNTTQKQQEEDATMLSSLTDDIVAYYNVEQLKEPAKGFAIAGTRIAMF